MAKKSDKDNPNYSESIQKALNKLISEEWLAGNTYLLFASSIDREDRSFKAVSDAFVETAVDELQDHMKSLIQFAMQSRYDVPATFSEFKKYADKEDAKLFESFKKGKEASYYLELAIESEKRAIESYEKLLEELDELAMVTDLQIVLKNNYYDEVEHLESFNFLKYTVDANLDYMSEE